MNDIAICPSILAADFANLGRDIAAAERAGADWIHFDVMDGHFVPNLTIGPMVLKAIRPYTSLPIDAHLMMDEPLRYAELLADAGADLITFHVELGDTNYIARTIRSYGAKVGVALSPETPASAVRGILDAVDLVLVMTVNPGFGGQKFMVECADKIKEIRQMSKNPALRIQVDGGINKDTVKLAYGNGADTIVAGTTIFGANDMAAAISELRHA